MENQNKDGVESGVVVRRGDHRSTVDVLLRVLAFALTLTSAIVLGVNKQTKVVSVKLVDTLPAVNVPVVAKWHYLSAFVYLVVANAVACSYAALSTIISLNRKKGWCVPFIAILDSLMVAMLFSADGAAVAIGIMGYKGNSHVRWNKVCNNFGRFCGQVAAAAALSLLGSIVFVLIVALTTLRLHRRSK
ncbi:hypothetical protein K2173_022410 [Erythroxylum novogranatense]|uniref:CASP-like protein n=1 Tax=Erythroxylum novogranatense TaxID=1862640 RepID=A0AAV8TIV7_9ROSI|nr:hypothetical protein K2173_022410 [Erythroxylum novogranatense]